MREASEWTHKQNVDLTEHRSNRLINTNDVCSVMLPCFSPMIASTCLVVSLPLARGGSPKLTHHLQLSCFTGMLEGTRVVCALTAVTASDIPPLHNHLCPSGFMLHLLPEGMFFITPSKLPMATWCAFWIHAGCCSRTRCCSSCCHSSGHHFWLQAIGLRQIIDGPMPDLSAWDDTFDSFQAGQCRLLADGCGPVE